MGSAATTAPVVKREITGSLGFVFWVALAYLVILLAAGAAFVTAGDRLPARVPATLGPVPIGVPWFGALGAVLISLSGVFDHRRDWDPTMKYWHFARPLIGVALGLISVLTFQAGILAVNSQPRPSAGIGNILYYLIAFVVGYREETFRQLVKRLGDVLLSPGGEPPPPAVRGVIPDSGPIAGGTTVVISGTGFTGTTEVRFGQSQARFTVDSDSQLTATSPAADAAGEVSITVATKQGTATGAAFNYA